jgi:hypothetical protein
MEFLTVPLVPVLMAMLVMMVMAVFVVEMMAVVFAAFGRHGQLAVQKRAHQVLHTRVWQTGPHLDAVLGENVERPSANATDDDNTDALLAEPARERTGLVFGRRHHLSVQRHFLFWVHLDQRKLAAAAEVSVEATVFMGNGNFHIHKRAG